MIIVNGVTLQDSEEVSSLLIPDNGDFYIGGTGSSYVFRIGWKLDEIRISKMAIHRTGSD